MLTLLGKDSLFVFLAHQELMILHFMICKMAIEAILYYGV